MAQATEPEAIRILFLLRSLGAAGQRLTLAALTPEMAVAMAEMAHPAIPVVAVLVGILALAVLAAQTQAALLDRGEVAAAEVRGTTVVLPVQEEAGLGYLAKALAVLGVTLMTSAFFTQMVVAEALVGKTAFPEAAVQAAHSAVVAGRRPTRGAAAQSASSGPVQLAHSHPLTLVHRKEKTCW
jgi:hypothetical protein